MPSCRQEEANVFKFLFTIQRGKPQLCGTECHHRHSNNIVSLPCFLCVFTVHLISFLRSLGPPPSLPPPLKAYRYQPKSLSFILTLASLHSRKVIARRIYTTLKMRRPIQKPTREKSTKQASFCATTFCKLALPIFLAQKQALFLLLLSEKEIPSWWKQYDMENAYFLYSLICEWLGCTCNACTANTYIYKPGAKILLFTVLSSSSSPENHVHLTF